MATKLEQLPDEILLIICNYLSQYNIINAFFGLNNRLNGTISQFFQSLDVSDNTDISYERALKLLLLVGPYLNSLRIKNIDLSSTEISLARNIQELTLINTRTDSIPALSNLTDLNIIANSFFQSIDFLFLSNNTLHSVYVASTSPLTIPIFSPPKYSTIKQLAVTLRSIDDFVHLLSICPELTCLNLALLDCNSQNQLKFDLPTSLRIFALRTLFEVNITFDQLKTLFQYLPSQLEQLSFEITTEELSCVDGQIWENYFKENFSQLNRFEFFILLKKEYPTGTQPLRLANILKTFQSLYWSSIIPQKMTGYYPTYNYRQTVCIHTETIPTVRRRRYFLN